MSSLELNLYFSDASWSNTHPTVRHVNTALARGPDAVYGAPEAATAGAAAVSVRNARQSASVFGKKETFTLTHALTRTAHVGTSAGADAGRTSINGWMYGRKTDCGRKTAAAAAAAALGHSEA